MFQPPLSVAAYISRKLIASYQGEVNVDAYRETVLVVHVLEDAIIDYKQLLIKVYLPFLIDGVQINYVLSACPAYTFLYYGLASADGACPVYLVVAGMKVLHDEHHEALVPFVPLLQGEQHVKKRICLALPGVSHHRGLLVEHDARLPFAVFHPVKLMVAEYSDGSVYPHAQVVDKCVFLGGQSLAVLGIYQVLRLDMSEHLFFAKLAFQQYLWQNKHAIVHVGVIVEVIAHIA